MAQKLSQSSKYLNVLAGCLPLTNVTMCHVANVSSFVVAQKLLQSSRYLNVSAGCLPLTLVGTQTSFHKSVDGCSSGAQ